MELELKKMPINRFKMCFLGIKMPSVCYFSVSALTCLESLKKIKSILSIWFAIIIPNVAKKIKVPCG